MQVTVTWRMQTFILNEQSEIKHLFFFYFTLKVVLTKRRYYRPGTCVRVHTCTGTWMYVGVNSRRVSLVRPVHLHSLACDCAGRWIKVVRMRSVTVQMNRLQAAVTTRAAKDITIQHKIENRFVTKK